MWTFLGVATFTYLYKKSSSVLSYIPKEVVMITAVFVAAGLLLCYVRFFHGQKLTVFQVVHLPFSALSFLPLVNHLVPEKASQRTNKAENSRKKVRDAAKGRRERKNKSCQF